MKRLIHFPLLLATLFLVQTQGCGCDEEPLEIVVCDYVVTPSGSSDSIEFPETEVGGERVRTLSIENKGSHTLGALDFQFEERNGDNYEVVLPEDFNVIPNSKEYVTIKFKPIAASSNIASSVTISHPPLTGVVCPAYQTQLEGSAYERPVVEPPYDGGTTEPPGPVTDGGTDPEDPPDIVVVDGGTFVVGPDGGLIPYTPPETEDSGVEEEEDADSRKLTAPRTMQAIAGCGSACSSCRYKRPAAAG